MSSVSFIQPTVIKSDLDPYVISMTVIKCDLDPYVVSTTVIKSNLDPRESDYLGPIKISTHPTGRACAIH